MTTTSSPQPWNDGSADQRSSTPSLRRGQRMSEAERATVGQDLLRRYEGGASIREICRETGYSIGRVRRLLEDAGVSYRRRGGANRTRGAHPAGTGAEPVAPPTETPVETGDEPPPSWPGEQPTDDNPAR